MLITDCAHYKFQSAKVQTDSHVLQHSPLKICSDSSQSRLRRCELGSSHFYRLKCDKQNAILYSASLLSLSYLQATCPSLQNQSAIPKSGRPKSGIELISWLLSVGGGEGQLPGTCRCSRPPGTRRLLLGSSTACTRLNAVSRRGLREMFRVIVLCSAWIVWRRCVLSAFATQTWSVVALCRLEAGIHYICLEIALVCDPMPAMHVQWPTHPKITNSPYLDLGLSLCPSASDSARIGDSLPSVLKEKKLSVRLVHVGSGWCEFGAVHEGI